MIDFSSYPYSAQLGTSTGAHRPPKTTSRRTLIEETPRQGTIAGYHRSTTTRLGVSHQPWYSTYMYKRVLNGPAASQSAALGGAEHALSPRNRTHTHVTHHKTALSGRGQRQKRPVSLPRSLPDRLLEAAAGGTSSREQSIACAATLHRASPSSWRRHHRTRELSAGRRIADHHSEYLRCLVWRRWERRGLIRLA